jgi:hypothetical protein
MNPIEPMKTIKNFFQIPFLASLALVLALAACDTTSPEPELSEEEADAVAEVMADALSDQTDGMMAGLYDLTATVSRDGIAYNSTSAKSDERTWRGVHRDFAASYDPETGEHLIQYRREIDRPNFTKSIGVNLSYLFEDVDGNFLEFPRRQSDDIATITFDGQRNGETQVTRPRGSRTSTVDREAQWVLDGLEDGSELMTLSGTQTHVGTHQVERNGATRMREFTLRLNIADVTIQKPTDDSDEALEGRVTGTLEYQAEITLTTVNGAARTNTYRGTVELEGNGRALLRIMGLRAPIAIDLANGDVERA